MMADRKISQLNEEKYSTTDYTDQQSDVPSRDEAAQASAQSDSHRKGGKNLDLSNSPLHRTRLSTRDSGYGTDFSPAHVVTPITNMPQAQQFVFDSGSQWQVQGQLNRTTWSSQDNALSQVATSTCNIHAQDKDLSHVAITTCNINAEDNALSQVATTTCNIQAQGTTLSHVAITTCNIHAQGNSLSQVATTTCNIHAQGNPLSYVATTTCNIHAQGNSLSQVATTTCNIHAQGNSLSQVATTTCNIHAQGNSLSPLATSSSSINSQGKTDINQRASTSTRLPKVVRISSQSEISHRDFKMSSMSFSEPSDSNQVQFDNEMNSEEDDSTGRHASSKSHRPIQPSPPLLRDDFHLSQSICNLPLHDTSYDNEEDDEDECTNRRGISKNMNITYDKNVPPRRRVFSLSTRSRRYCSEDNDESTQGACGGCDQSRNSSVFEADQRHGQRSRSLNEFMYAEDIAEDSRVRSMSSSEVNESSTRSIDFESYNDLESPLSCSQGFQPGYFDSDSKDNDSVFYFDHDSFEDEKDTRATQARPVTSYSVTFAEEVSSSSSGARQRRAGVTGSLPVSSGCLSTRFSNAGVTVSTQTPHVTSVMIQQILVSSIPLSNVARGTAASRLRRLSESGVPLPPRLAPLPDIIMSAGRDRSLSVPNLQALSLRQRAAREVGQELRRLSDEFNFRRNLSPVNEEFDGHPASYPTMRPRYLRHTITQFGSLLMDTFRGRQNS